MRVLLLIYLQLSSLSAWAIVNVERMRKRMRIGPAELGLSSYFNLNASMGIIGALGRGGLGVGEIEHFIQTDAAMNPGSSGGALRGRQGCAPAISSWQ